MRTGCRLAFGTLKVNSIQEQPNLMKLFFMRLISLKETFGEPILEISGGDFAMRDLLSNFLKTEPGSFVLNIDRGEALIR